MSTLAPIFKHATAADTSAMHMAQAMQKMKKSNEKNCKKLETRSDQIAVAKELDRLFPIPERPKRIQLPALEGRCFGPPIFSRMPSKPKAEESRNEFSHLNPELASSEEDEETDDGSVLSEQSFDSLEVEVPFTRGRLSEYSDSEEEDYENESLEDLLDDDFEGGFEENSDCERYARGDGYEMQECWDYESYEEDFEWNVEYNPEKKSDGDIWRRY